MVVVSTDQVGDAESVTRNHQTHTTLEAVLVIGNVNQDTLEAVISAFIVQVTDTMMITTTTMMTITTAIATTTETTTTTTPMYQEIDVVRA